MDKKTASTLLKGMSEENMIEIIVELANCSTKGNAGYWNTAIRMGLGKIGQ